MKTESRAGRRWLLRALSVLLWMGAVLPVRGGGIVFRYLAGRPGVSSEVVLNGAEDAGPFLDPREMLARGPGGWGYEAPYAVEFDGAATMRSALQENDSQPSGPDLTLESWVRPLDLSGSIHLLSNDTGSAGTILGLENGRPFFEIRIDGVTYDVTASAPVEVGGDYWIAATSDYSGSLLTLTLYVNGVEAASETVSVTLSSPYTIPRPIYVGTRSGGGQAGPSGSFTGLLYGTVYRRYVASEAYLSTPVPLDGSTYFGLPDFKDLAVDDPRLEMDQEINSSPIDLQRRFFLPHVNDGFIPQGTATSESIEGSDTTRLVYVSYYHRTPSSGLATQNSIVAEIDASSGHVRRTFRLQGVLETSHAGGVAYHDGALYISSGSYLERYPLPEYAADQRYIDLEPDGSGSTSVGSKASFVSTFRDTIWVGDYRTNSEVQPYLYGYPLGADGRPDVSDPVVYALPRYIQGVDFFDANGEVFVFLSRNRSSTEAEVLRYRPWQLGRYAVPDPDTVITMPHGIEDLSFFEDGSLWTNSESGTDFYQNGTPSWSIFFPFVYSVPASEVFPASVVTGTEAPPKPTGWTIEIYPNPARDMARLDLADAAGQTRVDLYDALGRHVRRVYEGWTVGAVEDMRVDVGDLASGLYILEIQTGGSRRVRTIQVVR